MDLGSDLKICAVYSDVLPRTCMKQERRSGGPMKQSSLTSCATGAFHSFDRVGTLFLLSTLVLVGPLLSISLTRTLIRLVGCH